MDETLGRVSLHETCWRVLLDLQHAGDVVLFDIERKILTGKLEAEQARCAEVARRLDTQVRKSADLADCAVTLRSVLDNERRRVREVAAMAEQSETERDAWQAYAGELEVALQSERLRLGDAAAVEQLGTERDAWQTYAGELEADRVGLQARVAELEAAPDALDEILESAFGRRLLIKALHPEAHAQASDEQRRALTGWAKLVNARIDAQRKNRREAV